MPHLNESAVQSPASTSWPGRFLHYLQGTTLLGGVLNYVSLLSKRSIQKPIAILNDIPTPSKGRALRLLNTSIVPLLTIFSLACSSSSSTSKSELPKVPSDLRITIGSGGGFSGIWKGYTLLAGDSIMEWEGKSIGENPKYVGTLRRDTLAQLWQTVQDEHFLEQQSHTVAANFVQLFTVSAGGVEREFIWQPSTHSDTTGMGAKVFRTRCLATVREALEP